MNALRQATRVLLNAIDNKVHFRIAYAHCDIPCGIYDPHMAQVAAHTVLRMDMLIADVMKTGASTADDRNKMVRYVAVKEQHAELCKHEIRVLWGDYFKQEHAKAFPELHGLIWDTLKLASKAKQSTSVADAEALLINTQKIAQLFWKTKNVETVRVKSFYPTEHEIVYPKV